MLFMPFAVHQVLVRWSCSRRLRLSVTTAAALLVAARAASLFSHIGAACHPSLFFHARVVLFPVRYGLCGGHSTLLACLRLPDQVVHVACGASIPTATSS